VMLILITCAFLFNGFWLVAKDPEIKHFEYVLVLCAGAVNILSGLAEIILRFANPRFIDITPNGYICCGRQRNGHPIRNILQSV